MHLVYHRGRDSRAPEALYHTVPRLDLVFLTRAQSQPKVRLRHSLFVQVFAQFIVGLIHFQLRQLLFHSCCLILHVVGDSLVSKVGATILSRAAVSVVCGLGAGMGCGCVLVFWVVVKGVITIVRYGALGVV